VKRQVVYIRFNIYMYLYWCTH